MFVPRVGVGVDVIVGKSRSSTWAGGARGRCAPRAPTIPGARGARGARSSTPSSRVLLAPSSGSMTKPPNTKMRPSAFNTRRAVGPGRARTRRLLSVCGRPAGGYRRRHRVSPSRELALSATNPCVARGRRGSRPRFPSKVLQARAVPTDKGLACASPAAAVVHIFPRGQTPMFWIHRSQLPLDQFRHISRLTRCAHLARSFFAA